MSGAKPRSISLPTGNAWLLGGPRGLGTREVSMPLPPKAAQLKLGPHSDHNVGEYRLGPLVGSGAVGHVYRAIQRETGAVVAVKVMNRPATSAAAAVRFMREVQALRQASSPHVVSMLGWGVTDDGHHYLAMELLEGESLQSLLRRQRRMAHDQVVCMVEQIAIGLEPAHDRGIVHRDIKPSNLFLARTSGANVWKILDFGLSKFSDTSSADSITQRHIVGTPGYLSPEQALAEPLDQRSDVFALATVAYSALTGSAPFWAEEPIGAVYRVVHEQPLAPSVWGAVHSDVDLALMLGMSKHVGDRPSTAMAFACILRDAMAGALLPDVRRHAQRVARAHPWSPMSRIDGREESWQTLPTLPTEVMVPSSVSSAT